MSTLRERHCVPCEGGVAPLDPRAARAHLAELHPEWTLEGNAIRREFRFSSYPQTIAFVNAVAWIAEREGHHPELEVGYRTCIVRYTTHAIGGLSENDFICAARIDALVAPA